MTTVSIATEDELSEAVAKRLLSEHRALRLGQTLRQGGSGYLRKRLPNFCEMAKHQSVLVLTDLDRSVCPGHLVSQWFAQRDRPARLVFRVAVRETEAWLLADHDGMRRFLQKPGLKLPAEPESLDDPKEALISLARRGPRRVREALVPAPGSTATKGLGYNHLLISEFLPHWDLAAAALRSPSLSRARMRLGELASACS